MNIDPRELKELREESLDHPIEKITSSRGHSYGQSRLVLVLSAGALLLGLGLAFFLLRVNEKYQVRERELGDQIAHLMNQIVLLGEQLEEDSQRIGLLVTDVETVQKRVGVSQSEIKKARALAEEIRREQQQGVQSLTRQLVTKADSQQVEALGKKTDTQFQEVDEQITGVQREVQASRQELEKTWQELSAMGLRLTEQGQWIATNGDALEELKRRGERDYLQFDARKKQTVRVADIVIELRKADYKKHRADLRFFYDDKKFDRKNVYTNTPLIFYVGRERIQYELVINQVSKDKIVGYISVPTGKLSTSLGLERSSD